MVVGEVAVVVDGWRMERVVEVVAAEVDVVSAAGGTVVSVVPGRVLPDVEPTLVLEPVRPSRVGEMAPAAVVTPASATATESAGSTEDAGTPGGFWGSPL